MRIFDFDKDTTHVGFADEAYWNSEEFRAVACVSARLDNNDYHEVERRLCASRCDAGAIVSEIKWNKLSNFRRQRDAASVLDAAVDLSASRELHIDVLVWDGRGRDHLDRLRAGRGNREVIHLQMMYRFLFLQVISRWRRVEGATAPFWTLAPDQHTGLDFPNLQREVRRDAEIAVDTTIEVKDVKETLNYSIQLADLLAGMAAYSHENWEYYGIWSRQGKQTSLQLPAPQWSTRFPLIDQFTQQCQDSDLGLTILSENLGFPGRGLWTPDPNSAQHTMNFQPFTLL